MWKDQFKQSLVCWTRGGQLIAFFSSLKSNGGMNNCGVLIFSKNRGSFGCTSNICATHIQTLPLSTSFEIDTHIDMNRYMYIYIHVYKIKQPPPPPYLFLCSPNIIENCYVSLHQTECKTVFYLAFWKETKSFVAIAK